MVGCHFHQFSQRTGRVLVSLKNIEVYGNTWWAFGSVNCEPIGSICQCNFFGL